MEYESNAPEKITHRVTLDAGDLLNAIHAFLRRSPEFANRVTVEYTELDIEAIVDNQVTVTWETELRPDVREAFVARATDNDTPEQQAEADGVTMNERARGGGGGNDGSPRQGRFGVVTDHGDKAATGDIATFHDDYEAADLWRNEQPHLSSRASIIFVAKSGSRYLPDKVTPAVDD